MGAPVLVTGASGNVGAVVLSGPREAAVPVRAADIDPGRVGARFPGVPVVRFDFTRPGALRYAAHARRTLGMPAPMVAVTTAIYIVARLGRAGGLTEDVQRVTGRPPLGFAQWAHQHRNTWARP